MGFRTGAYATVWDVRPKTPKITSLRISISKKPTGSDEYVQDFSAWVGCLGATVAEAAKGLNVGDRIKLGDVEVTNVYVKETETTYTNFHIYSFEKVETTQQSGATSSMSPEMAMANGLDPLDVPDAPEEEGLPF